MEIYTLAKDAMVLGDEPHPDYGYSYRAFVKERRIPVQFSSKSTDFLEGKTITAKTSEEKTARTSGKHYLWLTGVSVVDGNDKPAPSSRPNIMTEPKSANQKYEKDVSDHPIRIFLGCMPYVDFNHILDDEDYRRKYFEFVKDVSDELLAMTENIRSGVKLEPKGIEKVRRVANKIRQKAEDKTGEEELDIDDIFPEEER